MFSLFFSPLARYVAAFIAVFVIVLYGIHAIKKEAVTEIEANAAKDSLRRTQDAVRAGDAVDTSPDGLLKTDGHRRD